MSEDALAGGWSTIESDEVHLSKSLLVLFKASSRLKGDGEEEEEEEQEEERGPRPFRLASIFPAQILILVSY